MNINNKKKEKENMTERRRAINSLLKFLISKRKRQKQKQKKNIFGKAKRILNNLNSKSTNKQIRIGNGSTQIRYSFDFILTVLTLSINNLPLFFFSMSTHMNKPQKNFNFFFFAKISIYTYILHYTLQHT